MSIRKIAQMTGLSTATVSHAINGTREVSKKSRELVFEAIKVIGYKPNMAAKALRQQRSSTVAMLIPTVEPGMPTNAFFMEVISGAQNTLEQKGYSLIVSTYLDGIPAKDNASTQIKPLKVLQNQWIDGVIFVPNKRSYESVLNSIGKTLPFVLVDRKIPGVDCSYVHSDHVCAAFDATSLLIRNGKQRIGYIGGPEASFTGSDRYLGYCNALDSAGISLDKTMVCMTWPYTMQAGYSCAEHVIDAGADALFIANHILALGVLKYIQSISIRIPDQISLVTFDNYEWMEVLQPPITSVRQKSYEMGGLAANILLKKIRDPEYKEQIVLPTEIVLRRSHGTQS